MREVFESEGTGVNIGRLKKYLSENGYKEVLSKIENGDFDDPVPELAEGDKVRHKDHADLGTGVVKSIAKSGVRAYVDFGEIPDWNKRRLNWKPYPAYYLMTKLEKI